MTVFRDITFLAAGPASERRRSATELLMAKPPKSVGQLADIEAAVLGHDYIGTEHLLLAVSAQGGAVAAWALAAQGIEHDLLRLAVARIVTTAACQSVERRPWTPRAKKAAEFAIEEARALGHNYVGSEHLLLGLLRVENGVGVQAIQELGADPSAIQRAVFGGLEQL
jgi:ATP-dependent Clp protease ATP-binding subunit ClpC